MTDYSDMASLAYLKNAEPRSFEEGTEEQLTDVFFNFFVRHQKKPPSGHWKV
jgi:hypothetical protein